MSNWKPPTEWYLEQFSKEGEWKHGVEAEMVARVEGAMSTEAIDAISKELQVNDCPADQQKRGNLLRHWARIQLLEDSFTEHNEQRERTRASAKAMAKTMAKLKEQLDGPTGEVSHNASRYVHDRYRISYSEHLFR